MKYRTMYIKSEVLSCFLIYLVLIFALPSVALSTVFTPGSDNFVVLKLKETMNSQDYKRLHQLQMAHKKHSNEKNTLNLVKHLLYLGNQKSDPRFYDMAKTLVESRHDHFNQAEWLLFHAKVLQFHHKFTAALQQLEQLLVTNIHHLEARLMKISLLTTTGEINQIKHECQFLYQYHKNHYAEICIILTRGYTLPSASALQLLRHYATDIAQTNELSAGMQAWTLSLFAEIANYHGQYLTAESFYRKAIVINPQANYIKLNLVDTLLLQKKHSEAELWLDPTSTDISHLIRFIYIQKKLHKAIDKRQLHKLNKIFKLADARENKRHLREQALYAWWIQEDPKRAFDFAKANWEIQREFIDTIILYSVATVLNDKATVQIIKDWATSHSLNLTLLNQQAL